MKFYSILSAKSLILASAVILGTAGMVHAQGYGQGDSTQNPGDSTQSGTSSGNSSYGTKQDDQKSRYDSSRDRDNSRYSTDGTERYDDKNENSGTDGTGPKLKGRY